MCSVPEATCISKTLLISVEPLFKGHPKDQVKEGRSSVTGSFVWRYESKGVRKHLQKRVGLSSEWSQNGLASVVFYQSGL